jgi:hypothetical protein
LPAEPEKGGGIRARANRMSDRKINPPVAGARSSAEPAASSERLTDTRAAQKCPHLLRRVGAVHPESGEILVFLTNHHTLGASTIAAIYKDRWKIELFFKALKQNLKIETFVRTSANAVKTQIWTALIAMLLLRHLQLLSRLGWSLLNLVALLRMNLFTHRDFQAWPDQPFATPPDPTEVPQQQAFAFA